jgi:hypothetical protein
MSVLRVIFDVKFQLLAQVSNAILKELLSLCNKINQKLLHNNSIMNFINCAFLFNSILLLIDMVHTYPETELKTTFISQIS